MTRRHPLLRLLHACVAGRRWCAARGEATGARPSARDRRRPLVAALASGSSGIRAQFVLWRIAGGGSGIPKAGPPASCSGAAQADPSGAPVQRRRIDSSRSTNPARRPEKPQAANVSGWAVQGRAVLPMPQASAEVLPDAARCPPRGRGPRPGRQVLPDAARGAPGGRSSRGSCHATPRRSPDQACVRRRRVVAPARAWADRDSRRARGGPVTSARLERTRQEQQAGERDSIARRGRPTGRPATGRARRSR